jgi:bacteriorhodopsin
MKNKAAVFRNVALGVLCVLAYKEINAQDIQSDTAASGVEMVRGSRWIWYAVAGLISAFVFSRIVKPKQNKKENK